MSRYDIPDPKCQHKPVGRVTAGSLAGPHASTYVCSRPACIEDAKQWASASTHLRAEFFPFPDRQDQPLPRQDRLFSA